VDAGWKWNNEKGLQFSTGPSLQWYRYDADENEGRFIEGQGRVGSYDSLTVDRAKWHAGWTADLELDQRNHPLLPSWGSYLNLNLRAYHAINTYARSYGQVNMAIALYRSLNAGRTIVLANRTGAGITVGHAAFYQSQFLGGHENLQGFRQYRFAGDHLLWNNLELRIKLADWGGYILPGQFGFTGFYDLGRVWQRGESSRRWHQGVGGGFYYAPAQMALFQLVAGYSREGWLPYFTVGFRF
jgi:outer membrane protein assembly factor BamA